MNITESKLQGCLIIEPKVFHDDRGFFLETYQASRYSKLIGISKSFVQDNHSKSIKGVLRGLHFQKKKPQGKLVRVVTGEVFDVVVDIRPKSDTYGKWESFILNEEIKNQLWIPPGFAHGFMTLSEFADLEYKCTDYYDPSDEGTIIWNDPLLGIDWPINKPIVSKKDAQGLLFSEL